jgi:zinc protease
MRALTRFLGLSLSVAILFLGAAQAADFDLAARPPQDAAVLTGTLPNGMHYYVRQNAKPEKHVELRLAVKVGAIQETEAERGLAHFNEHMNFNGSKNFPPGEVVSYLESIGARFGADSNAYTSFDETVYMLTVPTEKEGALEKALLIMQDWAGAATLSPVEIDKERGVVNDELRGSKGARKRIRDKQNQLVFHGSRYADRMPIGLESVITGATHETVQGFYRKWYKPELMAIVAVGDFDAPKMEGRLKEVFGAIAASATPAIIPEWPVPPHDSTLYSVESDKELTSSGVQLYFKHEASPTLTNGDARRDAVQQLATGLLSMRLAERAQKPDPPYLGAGAGAFDYVLPLEVFSVSAGTKDGDIPKATAALMEELDRATQHGFLQEELDRVKTLTLTFAETRLKESAERRSGERVNEIVQSFLENLPLTSDQHDHDLAVALVPGISLDEVNAALRKLASTKSRVVLAQVPEKAGVPVPTADELKAIIEPAEARKVEAYVDDLAGKTLIPEAPESGKVVSRASIPEIGFEDITLSNGVRVLWKTTDFRADQILFSGFAAGGAVDDPRLTTLPAYPKEGTPGTT